MHLTYSPVTGEFYRGGARVGSQHGAGYITLWHEGKQWLAHRLAYHMLGVPLPKQVDHANGVRSCNAWHNLRDADSQLNQEARHKVVSRSGFIGVSKRKDTGRYDAHIKHKGKKTHLGCYATAEEASAAYQAKKAELHSLAPLKPDA